MNNELIVSENWNGKDVRIENTEERKVNLVDVCFCCGLTQKNKQGKTIANWKSGRCGVVQKLNTIYGGGENSLPQYIVDEIQQVLIDIDEVDDRNSIYVSNWLAQRIATECKSQTAMEFTIPK